MVYQYKKIEAERRLDPDTNQWETIPITVEQLNKLGAQGWKAVSVHQNEDGDIVSVLLIKQFARGA